MRHAVPLPRVPIPALCAAIFLLFVLAWAMLRPGPAPLGPAPARFDTARALAHVAALAQAPRPTGSVANARARDYLLAQIRALGLAPQVQVATVQANAMDWMSHAQITLATVHNVVVRKPGAAGSGGGTRPAVLITAHYDSGSTSLGAADGAASAAALLETLRVLQAGPPPANDLLFVFTDADAGQPLGLRAFMESHPWARHVRLALRFDHTGNRGPLELVDASHADGTALAAWARHAPDPHGSSFEAALYERLPQHAAALPPAAAGIPVLQFATTAGTLGDAGIQDLPQRLSRASLRQEGDTMLVLLRRLGDTSLAPTGAQYGQVFFALPLIGMVHYSVLLVWPLTLLVCALAAYAGAMARRQRTSGVDIVHAAFGFLFNATLAMFLTFVVREGLTGLDTRYALGILVDDGGVDWQLGAFLLLPAAILIPLQRRTQRLFGVATAALGIIAAGSVALIALSVVAPGASYVLAWPLLAALAAWLVLAHPRWRTWTQGTPEQRRAGLVPSHARLRAWMRGAHNWRRAALMLAGALPALLLMLPAARASLVFFTPSWLVLPVAIICTMTGLCGMVLDLLAPRLFVRPLLVATGACFGMAYAATPQWPTLPAPNTLVYYKDTPSWQAFWVAPPAPLDAWSRRIFPHTMHPYQLPYLFGNGSPPVWYAAAVRDDSIAWPDLVVEKDERSEEKRHVEFVLRSKNHAPELVVRIWGGLPVRSSVNGRLLTDHPTFSWKLTLRGMDDTPQRIALDFDGDPPFMVYVQERIPGLPPRDLPPRPAEMTPLLPMTGTTVAADILRFD